jgi:hypothetical protein
MSMAFSYNNMRILFTFLLVILIVLIVSSQLGAACRPLQDERTLSREFNGLLFQFLSRGPPKQSTPDPAH